MKYIWQQQRQKHCCCDAKSKCYFQHLIRRSKTKRGEPNNIKLSKEGRRINIKKGQKTKPDTTKNAKNLAGTLYTGGTKNSIKNSEYFTSYNDAKFADKVIKI